MLDTLDDAALALGADLLRALEAEHGLLHVVRGFLQWRLAVWLGEENQ